jgi:hypothetical protein
MFGPITPPPGLADVVAIAGGGYHCLALKSNGTVVAWGDSMFGPITVPPGLADVAAIAAGESHSLALKTDGTVVAWGNNGYGQSAVPPGLASVVAIAGGGYHSLALKANGTVVAWGNNGNGQTNVPPGLSNVVAIAAGAVHSLALKTDGTVVAWGDNGQGQAAVPPGLATVTAIAGGQYHSLALRGKSTALPAGLSCSTGGVVIGMAAQAVTSVVTFVVHDSVGATTNKPLTIVIAPNPNTRPAIDASIPASGALAMNEGTSRVFGVTAHDPEAAALTYAWTWDGVAVGIPSNTYAHAAAWGHAGLHTLRCYVSDDLWLSVVFAQWDVTVVDVYNGERATNNVPKWWLAQHGLTNFNADAMGDGDHDGMFTWQEWVAGSDPTTNGSVFQFRSVGVSPGQGAVIRWPSIPNRFYNLSRSTNLLSGTNMFSILPGAAGMPATPPENVYTDPVEGFGPFYYKISVYE